MAASGWLLGDRAFRLLIHFPVTLVVARYLGVEQFGAFNYALALAGLIGVLVPLGLDAPTKKGIIEDPPQAAHLLGTSLLLKVGAAFFLYAALVVVVTFGVQDGRVRALALITGLTMFLHPLLSLDLLFQSRLQVSLSVVASSSAAIVGAIVRLSMVMAGAPLIWFGWGVIAEPAMAAVILVALFLGYGRIRLKFSREAALLLMKSAWPLLISSAAFIIYMKIDQVMLAKMTGTREVGLYSAAVRLSEVWYTVPHILSIAVLPAILLARRRGASEFYGRIQRYFDLNVTLAFLIVLPMMLFAGPVVRLLFGSEYAAAAAIVTVHIWGVLFIFLGGAREPCLIAEGQYLFSMWATLSGAAMNVIMNLLLIPNYGGLGAAVATVISFMVFAFASGFLYKPSRKFAIMQLRSLNLPAALARLARPRKFA